MNFAPSEILQQSHCGPSHGLVHVTLRGVLQGIRPGQVPQVVLQADTPPHPGTPGSVCSEGGGGGGLTIQVPAAPNLQSQLHQLQDSQQQQQQMMMNAHLMQQQVSVAEYTDAHSLQYMSGVNWRIFKMCLVEIFFASAKGPISEKPCT